MICSEDMNKGVVITQARIEMIYAFFGIIIVLVIQGEHSAFKYFYFLLSRNLFFYTDDFIFLLSPG